MCKKLMVSACFGWTWSSTPSCGAQVWLVQKPGDANSRAVGLPFDRSSSRLLVCSAQGGAAVQISDGSLTSLFVRVFERIAWAPIIGALLVALTSIGARIT